MNIKTRDVLDSKFIQKQKTLLMMFNEDYDDTVTGLIYNSYPII